MTTAEPVTFYQVGFLSKAGYGVRFDATYGTAEAAWAAAKQMNPPARHVFEVTVKEVIA